MTGNTPDPADPDGGLYAPFQALVTTPGAGQSRRLYAMLPDGGLAALHLLDAPLRVHGAEPDVAIDGLGLAIAATGALPTGPARTPIPAVLAVGLYREDPTDRGGTNRKVIVVSDGGTHVVLTTPPGQRQAPPGTHGAEPPEPDTVALHRLSEAWKGVVPVFGNGRGGAHLRQFQRILDRGDGSTPRGRAVIAVAGHVYASLAAGEFDRAGEDIRRLLVETGAVAFDTAQAILARLDQPPLRRDYTIRLALPLIVQVTAHDGDQAFLKALDIALSAIDESRHPIAPAPGPIRDKEIIPGPINPDGPATGTDN